MKELVERKIKNALRIRKINVWTLISSIASLIIACLFLFSDNLYFRTLFLLPIIGSIYYIYRIKTYKKDLEYLPKFLYAYSKFNEKEDVKGGDEPKQSNPKVIYKDRIVYKKKIVKVPVEKIVVEKIPVEKIVEKIVYKTKEVKPEKGYVKKQNIYENNDIFSDIENMLANQFYNVPLKERAKQIYSLISQKNVDRKIQYEYEKEKGS